MMHGYAFRMMMKNLSVAGVVFLAGLAVVSGAPKNVLMIAGPKSHGLGEHEHPEGCALLARHLASSGLDLTVETSLGWPEDSAKVEAADALVIYGDGLAKHPAKGRLDELRKRFAAGRGLLVIHFALEPADAGMGEFFMDAIGGRFEVDWSVNPVWQMKDPELGKHPIGRGVKPFEIQEEFYYHLRLRDDVVPLLRALPPLDSLGKDGPRSGNPSVRKALQDGELQTLAWAFEAANGARGFGFTGGHFHRNWAHPDFRKLMLNAIVWTAGVEVPEGGVRSEVKAEPIHRTIDEAIARGDLGDVKLHLEKNPASANQGGNPTSRPPLEQAILRKKPDIALVLIAAGADANAADRSGRTAVLLAVERNLPGLIPPLLKAGANADAQDKDGWTALHHAAAKNQPQSIKFLMDGGAKPNVLSKLGGTPLHEAGASGGEEVIKLLLAAGIDRSLRSSQGVTALDLAKQYNNHAGIKLLEKE
jgi:hypothetical protein